MSSETPSFNSASFRDPSGFVFSRNGRVLRQINQSYQTVYDALLSSGLYKKLTSMGILVKHTEENLALALEPTIAYRVIAPEHIPFILYPYEWSFAQYRAAALTTLQVLREALSHGFTLKDASAFNIQFIGSRPVFIDTLSFEFFRGGEPWIAYKQFCQHFLAPLTLMGTCDPALVSLMQTHIDGIPLKLTSRILGWRSWLRFSTLTHIHMHARMIEQHSSTHNARAKTNPNPTAATFRKSAFLGLIQNLQDAVSNMRISKQDTEWGNYYSDTNYNQQAFANKEFIVRSYLSNIEGPTSVGLDLGANNGHFSRIMAETFAYVISADIDPVAVQKNFVAERKSNSQNVLPALLNLTNPSPSVGFANTERPAFFERFRGQAVLALALIHHIVIGNNVPMHMAAAFFAKIAPNLIIEFPEKSDSQVARLFSCRPDIFPNYNRNFFESCFSEFFEIRESQNIEGTARWLYRMERKS